MINQVVEYENESKLCFSCHKLGHESDKCQASKEKRAQRRGRSRSRKGKKVAPNDAPMENEQEGKRNAPQHNQTAVSQDQKTVDVAVLLKDAEVLSEDMSAGFLEKGGPQFQAEEMSSHEIQVKFVQLARLKTWLPFVPITRRRKEKG